MRQEKIVVIDYGIGNLYSVLRALEYCGARQILVTSSAEEVLIADKLILPGVGAFADGMNGLHKKNLINPILQHAKSGKPLLGICLGMQLLASVGEEFGTHEGLDLIPGCVVPIPAHNAENGGSRKIPHIGWANLLQSHEMAWEQSLMRGLKEDDFVYLIHSYHFQPELKENLLAIYDYDGYHVTAAIRSNNIYGYQFHPEKSGPVGLRLISNFLEL